MENIHFNAVIMTIYIMKNLLPALRYLLVLWCQHSWTKQCFISAVAHAK